MKSIYHPDNWCVVDYETYYDSEYSLRKLSAIEYIKHPLFEEQSLVVLCPRMGYPTPTPIPMEGVAAFYDRLRNVAPRLTLVGQNSIGFDGLILNVRHNIRFGGHIDTMVLSQYRWGSTVARHSLEAIATRLDLHTPQEYVDTVTALLGEADSRKLSQALAAVKGVRREDMDATLHAALTAYCQGDVWLTHQAALELGKGFPSIGLRTMTYNANALIDLPLRLDTSLLATLKDDYASTRRAELMVLWHLLEPDVRETMSTAMRSSRNTAPDPEEVMMKHLRSKDKLAWLLMQCGAAEADLPTKAGKNGTIYAFSKTDIPFTDFGAAYEDADTLVPEIVRLRLDYSTSATESKLARFLAAGIAAQGHWGMHVKTYGAPNTARHSGGNATASSPHNIKRSKPLFYTHCKQAIRWNEDAGVRDAVTAPDGQVLLVYDSSGIELRVVGFVTQEPSITGPLTDKSRDLYVEFAQRLFSNPALTKSDKVERFVGKIACLAGDTEVLTSRGWIPITEVLPDDKLWDGYEWVSHDGVVYQGDKTTIDINGVRMTPDHGVFIDGITYTPSESVDTSRAASYGQRCLPVE